MMKRFLSVILSVLLLVCLGAQVLAANDQYFWDEAGLFTDAEAEILREQLEEVSEDYQCGVYIVFVNDYRPFTDASSVYQAAKLIYIGNDFGYGPDNDGVMLFLSMNDRDYSLIAYGYGNTAFTDYGKDVLSEVFLDDFADDRWFDGCQDYIVKSAEMLAQARSGVPLDVYNAPQTYTALHVWICSIAVGFLLALIICLIWRATAKRKVREKTEASSYVGNNGFILTGSRDNYTHTTYTRTKIEQSSGGSGRGGTSIDIGGFSGKSGKF